MGAGLLWTVGIIAALLLLRWLLFDRWGAAPAVLDRALPGDEAVWHWLLQMGDGRSGWARQGAASRRVS